MGEYDPCGVPIGEGYVDAVLDGVPTRRRIPFPRAADDVYHITKINDTNFLAMATRVWSLAATDVMQSIVYGTRTTLWSQEARLATRFDCDPVFGSVLNRFAAQAVLGVPLTIHGDGTQTTGLISLVDSVSALAHWIAHPADRGTHRVVNQATETRIAIRDVAQLVQRVGAELGLEVSVEMGLDPRHETEREGSCGPACTTTLRSSGIPMISLEQGVRLLLTDLLEHRARLRPAALRPEVDWKGAAAPPSGAEPFDDAVEELAGRGPSEAGSLPTARRA